MYRSLVIDREDTPGASSPPWPPLLAARGALSQSSVHAHHGMHIVLATRGTLACRVDHEESFVESAGVITAPDVAHEIKTRSADVLLVFIDPESRVGAALRSVIVGDVRRVSAEERDAIDTGLDPRAIMAGEGEKWTQSVLDTLGVRSRDALPPMHPSVRRALALLQASDADESVSLGALAARVGLSEGRLMHAFTESVGIPLRPYLAWLRVQRAVVSIASGQSLAAAAQASGFADAPHMTRTFRRMLGLTPSMVQEAIVASAFKTGSRG